MMSFRGDRLSSLPLPTAVVWFIDEIAEAKGRQALYTRQAPQVLKALRDMALVQSAESSNRIEGVTIDPDRLRPLGHARPRDRSEREIFGYRHALNLIHTNAAGLSIAPSALQQLHRTIQEDSGDAGHWKNVENEIIVARLFLERRAASVSGVRESRRRRSKPSRAKRALVQVAIDSFTGSFTLVDLERVCPAVSRDMVRRVLKEQRRQKLVECVGRGPGARWRRLPEAVGPRPVIPPERR